MRRILALAVSLISFLAGGCQIENGRLQTKHTWLNSVFSPSPAALVRQAATSDDPDLRRDAIGQLADRKKCRVEPYLKLYGEVALNDPDPSVRRVAVRALGIAGDANYLPQLIQALNEPDDAVRVEAAAALDSVVGDPAVDPLMKHCSNDANADVRARSAAALRNYPHRDVLDVLLSGLGDEEFAVRHASRASLRQVTGEDCGYDIAAWQRRLIEKSDPFHQSEPPEAQRPWWDLLGVTREKA